MFRLYCLNIKNVTVSLVFWGRICELRDDSESPNALSGAALLMPSALRFDPAFVEWMEDIEFLPTSTKSGFNHTAA